ncbi:RNA binding protein [Mycobacterium phage EniyanLRS]|uniref:RNA binding protein n=1 Tax=Mycobacterium phage EniyanLRS TaxID=1933770 RepID=A0A2H4GSU1_9CAUD|nr:RNA binding protein [Mycobacterium phage EniyanLRS]
MIVSDVCTLLGKRVVVILEQGDCEMVVSVGQLLGFGDGGDVEILEDDGFVHYCWPMLDVREIPDDWHRGNIVEKLR